MLINNTLWIDWNIYNNKLKGWNNKNQKLKIKMMLTNLNHNYKNKYNKT